MQETLLPGLVLVPDNAPFLFHTALKCIPGGKTVGVLGWPLESLDFEYKRALENSVISEYQASVFYYRRAEGLDLPGPRGQLEKSHEATGKTARKYLGCSHSPSLTASQHPLLSLWM